MIDVSSNQRSSKGVFRRAFTRTVTSDRSLVYRESQFLSGITQRLARKVIPLSPRTTVGEAGSHSSSEDRGRQSSQGLRTTR